MCVSIRKCVFLFIWHTKFWNKTIKLNKMDESHILKQIEQSTYCISPIIT